MCHDFCNYDEIIASALIMVCAILALKVLPQVVFVAYNNNKRNSKKRQQGLHSERAIQLKMNILSLSMNPMTIGLFVRKDILY